MPTRLNYLGCDTVIALNPPSQGGFSLSIAAVIIVIAVAPLIGLDKGLKPLVLA